MARSTQSLSSKYELLYKIEFTCLIRGHHIYKDCYPRKKAQTYDKHALGAYKKVEGVDVLVGSCSDRIVESFVVFSGSE